MCHIYLIQICADWVSQQLEREQDKGGNGFTVYSLARGLLSRTHSRKSGSLRGNIQNIYKFSMVESLKINGLLCSVTKKWPGILLSLYWHGWFNFQKHSHQLIVQLTWITTFLIVLLFCHLFQFVSVREEVNWRAQFLGLTDKADTLALCLQYFTG